MLWTDAGEEIHADSVITVTGASADAGHKSETTLPIVVCRPVLWRWFLL